MILEITWTWRDSVGAELERQLCDAVSSVGPSRSSFADSYYNAINCAGGAMTYSSRGNEINAFEVL